MTRLIDADNLVAGIEKLKKSGYYSSNTERILLNTILTVIAMSKTIDPIKHGRWIFIEQLSGGYYSYKCSECQHLENVEKREMLGNYCPHCGAKMLGMEE